MVSGRTPRRRAYVGGLSIALVAVLLLGLVPAGAIGGTPSGAPSSSGALGESAAHGATAVSSFASRSDYSPAQAAEVSGAAPAAGTVEVVVTFEPTNSSLFDAPASGAARLTLGEIGSRFGLSPADYAAATAYFVGKGLTVVHSGPDRLSLSLSGPASSVDAAFGTSLEAGEYEGHSVMFPATSPSLPSGLEAEVASVVGLTAGFDTFDLSSLVSEASDPVAATPSQSGDLVTPAIARSIYDLSGLYNLTSSPKYATGQGIALLLWGAGYDPNDITTFYAKDYPSDFPAPTLDPTPVDGAPSPSPSALDDPCQSEVTELTLDIEWSGSMAPGATLYPVYAPEEGGGSCEPSSSSMADAMHAALSLPVSTISMSFGVAEAQDAALVQAWETDFAEGVQEGITFLAATGDTGGYGTPPPACSGGPVPEYPASSPDVLAVGGTDVSLARNVLGQITGFSESAWNESGGGFSTQFTAPVWQSVTGSSYRGMPDVSATAAENFLYYGGASRMAGGTSFATPLWAGLIAEMDAMHGSALGLVAPRLYSIGGAESSGKIGLGLADITSGSTCIGTAGPGWDPETGWGSPRALLLYEDLTATFVTLALAVSPSSAGPGETVTIEAHLANETTGAPIAGVPVIVSLSSSTNLGPCTGTFGSATPTTDGDGNVSVAVTVPSCYLGSHATAAVEVVTNGYYGTNSTTIPINLLAFLPFLGGITQFPYNVIGFVGIIAIAVAIGYVLGRPRRGTSSAPPPPPPGADSPAAPPSASEPVSTPVAGPPAPPSPPPTAPSSATTPQKP